ncbi:MAG TPA: hypothetical protein VMA75_04440 [Candidatus Paceibacterota bacterium]|nr:hypothetical protein [Candidatus Paceibacterota bacterium]
MERYYFSQNFFTAILGVGEFDSISRIQQLSLFVIKTALNGFSAIFYLPKVFGRKAHRVDHAFIDKSIADFSSLLRTAVPTASSMVRKK